jgi:hypothetical protein
MDGNRHNQEYRITPCPMHHPTSTDFIDVTAFCTFRAPETFGGNICAAQAFHILKPTLTESLWYKETYDQVVHLFS